MKVLCTGVSGFIGFNFALSMERIPGGGEFLGIDIKPPPSAQVQNFINCDIEDLHSLDKEFSKFKPDIVVHLAARTDLDGKVIGDYSANIEGVKNICEMIKKYKVKKALFFSSRLVNQIGYVPKNENDYSPTTLYGVSKVEGEKIVRSELHRSNYIIVRPTSIWGEWFDVPYRNFFDAVSRGLFFKPGRLRVYKSFGYVGNVVKQMELLCGQFTKFQGQTIYTADRNNIELSCFSEQIAECFNVRTPYSIPLPIYKVIAGTGSLIESILKVKMPITRFRLNNMITNMIYDLDWLDSLDGYEEQDCSLSIKNTVNWMKRG
ncbi:MAG: nucleoside-diphosphate-sugar epimerase [Bermanella sp.]|jgi:nucleoside-diphosphate-sugar epimerase